MQPRSYAFRNEGSIAALTALRVGVGLIFVAHGWQKLSNPEGTAQAFASMGVPAPEVATWLAIGGELFGGLGLALGALTPLSAFGSALVMFFAIVFVHLGKGVFADRGGWELPLTLMLVSLYFVARGAGPISVDELVRKVRANRRDEPDVVPLDSRGAERPV
jgi:putative oxidoreductase